MMHAVLRSHIFAAVLLSFLIVPARSQATPVDLRFSGTVFAVFDPSDVYSSSLGNASSFFLTYDPALLPGMVNMITGSTSYQTAPGETSITCSFITAGGDSFTCDNSLSIRITVRNTPDWNVAMNPGDGEDAFNVDGAFVPNLTFSLILLESLGTNPLSSNALPTGPFGGGPGSWHVSDIYIDRTDLFARLEASVSTITSVPEPSSLSLCLMAGLALWTIRRRAKTVPQS